MSITPEILPDLIQALNDVIADNALEVAELDRAIGDGDHVVNLQRGLTALVEQQAQIAELDWVSAWQKIGMICMSKIGGASGSLFGTLFVSMAKAAKGKTVDIAVFAEAFLAGVESMKLRGKAEAGEKTMLDVLIPVALFLQQSVDMQLPDLLEQVQVTASKGVESTRDMLATKGRASFLGERSLGHIDAGAKSSQLMIGAIVVILQGKCE
ncbi:MAG: dihydroxyacetone kinase subunit L [Methyloprofundus sp.]|nr:MAG: dihydroxyacetone kinase subunit L [Methyloprofundus sp.]